MRTAFKQLRKLASFVILSTNLFVFAEIMVRFTKSEAYSYLRPGVLRILVLAVATPTAAVIAMVLSEFVLLLAFKTITSLSGYLRDSLDLIRDRLPKR